MWICPDCGEKLEDQFDSCWKCAGKIAIPSATNTTTKRRKGCLATIFGVIVFVFFVVPLGYKFLTHSVYKSSSPAAGLGIACFFQESDAMVSVIDLYVKDYKKSRFDLVKVGTVSGLESGPYPKRAVWSRDGTIVAVKSGYVEDSQKEITWTHAYDFRVHQAYGEFSPQGTSMVIKELLNSRGGEGEVILSNEESFKSLSRPYYPWELFPLSKFP